MGLKRGHNLFSERNISPTLSTKSSLILTFSDILQSYPLSEEDQLIHAKVQEHLGQLALDGTNVDLAEKWYKKSLRTIMDMFETEEKSPLYLDLQNLKCK